MKADPTSRTVSLEIPSDLRLLELAHCLAKEIPHALGVPKDDAEAVGNAVLEAVGNAMRHGNRLDPATPVSISFLFEGTSLTARVSDRGEGFDPTLVDDPTAMKNILKSCGRGLFLMRAFVDSVDISPRRGGGTTVTLRKTFSS